MIVGDFGAVDGGEMNLGQGIGVSIVGGSRRGIMMRKRKGMMRTVHHSDLVRVIVVHDLVLEKVTGLSRRKHNLGGLMM